MFQKPEDFMQDFNQFKKGKRYKIIYFRLGECKTEYCTQTIYQIRLDSIRYHYGNNPIHVIDLDHKFKVVCKVE